MSNRVRMYVNARCQECEKAIELFKSFGIEPQIIEIGFDDIIKSGIRALSDGKGLPVPITISSATEEIFVGNDPLNLTRIALASGGRPVTADPAATGKPVAVAPLHKN